MYLDDNPDYKTVWQLAHDWANLNPEKTDTKAIPPVLREHIIRLILAIRNKKISARTRKRSIFIDDSVISLIVDTPHYLRTLSCLLKDAINKSYLDSLYIKREDVIDLCITSHHVPPSCWMPKYLPDGQIIKKEAKNYRPANETEDRIRCQTIATVLWELDPAIHLVHMAQSTIMQRFGNGRDYGEETVKDWIKSVDPQKKRKKGAPPKVQYKIELIKDPQLGD
ncbi:hypothetical protein [Nitrosomonas sp. wSCUT-2]